MINFQVKFSLPREMELRNLAHRNTLRSEPVPPERKNMKIAQIAPLMESVPPRLYGGSERIASYLTDELVGRHRRCAR